MKNEIITVFLIAFSICGLTTTYAQQTLSASGSNAAGNGGSASYTVGQVTYATNAGSAGSVSQGVQQAYEIMITSSTHEIEGIELLISAYPNPVSNHLQLRFEQVDFNGCKYHLFDLNGKMISSNDIYEKETLIYLEDIFSSTYFLKVFKGNKEIITFKILKK